MYWTDLGRAGVPFTLVATLLTLMTGCVVGPDYVRPPVVAPAAYKELNGWKVAQPKDDHLSRGAWWELFGDP
jgi:hypothetical protein